jgi:ABC-2 type transport system ATP-binding protein
MSSLMSRMNTEIFVLNLREPLSALPDLSGYPMTLSDPHTLEIEVSREQPLNDIFLRLTQLGIHVVSMRNKVNRLEEIFMRLVEGKAQQAAGAGG